MLGDGGGGAEVLIDGLGFGLGLGFGGGGGWGLGAGAGATVVGCGRGGAWTGCGVPVDWWAGWDDRLWEAFLARWCLWPAGDGGVTAGDCRWWCDGAAEGVACPATAAPEAARAEAG